MPSSPTHANDVFTPDDLAFFDQNGYVILRQAVDQASVEAVVDTLFKFLGISRQQDETWYQPPVSTGGGMVELYQHQSLWDNRQNPRIYHAFRQLWQRQDLWVSIDRVSFKPPQHPDFPKYQKTGFLHLDTTTETLPIPFRLQGVLYLTDTSEEQGGFHCLPGWHKRTKEWIEVSQPHGGSIKGDAMYELPIKPIPAKAGDFLIWHVGLPHGNGYNRSSLPRMAQYITMWPQDQANRRLFTHDLETERELRIKAWREHSGPLPDRKPFPGDPRGWERKNEETARLTPLGKRLLGQESWEASV